MSSLIPVGSPASRRASPIGGANAAGSRITDRLRSSSPLPPPPGGVPHPGRRLQHPTGQEALRAHDQEPLPPPLRSCQRGARQPRRGLDRLILPRPSTATRRIAAALAARPRRSGTRLGTIQGGHGHCPCPARPSAVATGAVSPDPWGGLGPG